MKIKWAITLLSVITFFANANVNAGGMDDRGPDGLPKYWHADLSGVWATGAGFFYLYPDGNVMRLSEADCSLTGYATWEFELGTLSIRDPVTGKRLVGGVILDVPVKPDAGDKMVLDTTHEWVFMSPDTDEEC